MAAALLQGVKEGFGSAPWLMIDLAPLAKPI